MYLKKMASFEWRWSDTICDDIDSLGQVSSNSDTRVLVSWCLDPRLEIDQVLISYTGCS